MKKIKSVLLGLVLLILLLEPSMAAGEDGLESVVIDAKIHEDGNMDVVEEWTLNSDSGLNQYIYKPNIESMEMLDISFSVNGRKMELIEDVAEYNNIPEEDRKGVFTLSQIADDIMIIFMDHEPGMNKYILEYRINGAVQSFTDADALYYLFIYKLASRPQGVKLTIDIEGVKLSEDNSDVWAFGYDDPMYYLNGDLVTETKELKNPSEIRVFAKFDKDLLSPTSEGRGSSEDFMNSFQGTSQMSEEDKVEGKTAQDSLKELTSTGKDFLTTNSERYERIIRIVSYVLAIVLVFTVIYLIIWFTRNFFKPINLKKAGLKRESYDKEIPAKGDLTIIHLFIKYLYNNKFDKPISRILSSYLISWLNKGYIEIEFEENNGKKRPKILGIKFLEDNPVYEYESEESFYNFFSTITDKAYLSFDEAKDCMYEEYGTFSSLVNKAYDEGSEKLRDQGYLYRNSIGILVFTDEGLSEYKKFIENMNYINNFKKINKKSKLDEKDWQDLILVAALFQSPLDLTRDMEGINPDYSPKGYESDSYLSHVRYLSKFAKEIFRTAKFAFIRD